MYQRFLTNVLFPAPEPTYTVDSFPGELVWAPKGPTLDDEKGLAPSGDPADYAPLLLLKYESARFMIIYFHSNAEDLGGCRWFCHFLREQFQVHVLAVEYPGYGICAGPPSFEAIISNAYAALQFATHALKLPLERIMLFGRSIGTGPTLVLASKFRVAGVILITPFLSIRKLFREKIGPLAYLVNEWFDNETNMRNVKSPTMIVHGCADRLISHHHSDALFRICDARKLFINPQRMEHNTNLTTDVSFLVVPMFRFFSLPDYSFQELDIPAWAFDKRRSPFYVRPEMQVSCDADVPDGNPVAGVPKGSRSIPRGDEDDSMDMPDARIYEDDAALPPIAGVAADRDWNKGVTILTQPTVRHSNTATKQWYIWPNGLDQELESQSPHPLESNSSATTTVPSVEENQGAQGDTGLVDDE